MMSTRVRDTLQEIEFALSSIERWLTRSSSGISIQDALNQSTFSFRLSAGEIELDALKRISRINSSFADLRLSRNDFEIRMRVSAGGLSVEEVIGDWSNGFSDASDRAQAAKDDNRLDTLYSLANLFSCNIFIALRNDPLESTFHWIKTASSFLDGSASSHWLRFAAEIAKHPHARRLIIQDADECYWSLVGLVLHGPRAWPDAPQQYSNDPANSYRRSHLLDEREGLCSPEMFISDSTGDSPDQLRELTTWLERVSQALAWVWLADGVDFSNPAAPELEFKGVRLTRIKLRSLPSSESISNMLVLWKWATDGTDAIKHEALQQAISFAVSTTADLDTAAEHVLRTGRYLTRIARQGPIAEALATRRAARESAFSTARAGSQLVQSTARAFVDRVGALFVAAIAVVIGNQQALLQPIVAMVLLAGIGLILGFSFSIALAFEHRLAKRSLEALVSDLDAYRDTLVSDDINSLKNLDTIAAARSSIRRAFWMLVILFALALTSLGGALSYIYTSPAASRSEPQEAIGEDAEGLGLAPEEPQTR